MSKNCNRVSNYSTMTVFVESHGTRVRYVSRMCFSKRLDSIESLSLTECIKKKKIRQKRRMSAQAPSRSDGVVQAERGSQLVCFLSNYYFIYLLLTFKNKVLNSKTDFPYS